jgi:hypothetical protein
MRTLQFLPKTSGALQFLQNCDLIESGNLIVFFIAIFRALFISFCARDLLESTVEIALAMCVRICVSIFLVMHSYR